jgi:multidrug efflux pump
VTGVLGRKGFAGRVRRAGRRRRLHVQAVPAGFVPAQDKQYLIGFAQLPDAASLDRTEAVIRRMSDIAKEIPGVERPSPSRPVDQRLHQCAERRHRVHHPETVRRAHHQGAVRRAIAAEINKRMGGIQDAFVMVFRRRRSMAWAPPAASR